VRPFVGFLVAAVPLAVAPSLAAQQSALSLAPADSLVAFPSLSSGNQLAVSVHNSSPGNLVVALGCQSVDAIVACALRPPNLLVPAGGVVTATAIVETGAPGSGTVRVVGRTPDGTEAAVAIRATVGSAAVSVEPDGDLVRQTQDGALHSAEFTVTNVRGLDVTLTLDCVGEGIVQCQAVDQPRLTLLGGAQVTVTAQYVTREAGRGAIVLLARQDGQDAVIESGRRSVRACTGACP
jgi:hypothetical protein